jgi:leader peptidase (prepilin peptidase) / N-methyltransferase
MPKAVLSTANKLSHPWRHGQLSLYWIAMTTEAELHFFRMVLALFATFFGACVGSFLNVCIYRIPRDESVVRPRSHCPCCGMMIPWYQNIPVASWLALRGRCAGCHKPISFRYTLVELLTAMLFLAVFMQWAAPAQLHMQPLTHAAIVPVYWLVTGGFILGTFADFEHFIIPDSVTVGGMIAGAFLSTLLPQLHGQSVWWQGLLHSVIGLLCGFGLLFLIAELGTRIFKKEAMGFGDVKLMGAIGAFFGWQAVLFTVFASSLLGSVAGVLLIIFGGVKMQSRIPFGPYLCAGAMIWMFWGTQIIDVYLGLMMRP